MVRFKKIMILGGTVINFGLARIALAACETSGGLTNPLKSCTFAELITNIAKIVAQIGLPIAAIAIIYAGFLFVTAGGNEEKVTKARKTFLWTVIGTALLLGALAIAEAIKSFITTLK
jgi:hypothetical protein